MQEIIDQKKIPRSLIEQKILSGKIKVGIIPDTSWTVSIFYKSAEKGLPDITDFKVDEAEWYLGFNDLLKPLRTRSMKNLQGVWLLPKDQAQEIITSKSPSYYYVIQELKPLNPNCLIDKVWIDLDDISENQSLIQFDDLVITDNDLGFLTECKKPSLFETSEPSNKFKPQKLKALQNVCKSLCEAVNLLQVNKEKQNPETKCHNQLSGKNRLLKIKKILHQIAEIDPERFKNSNGDPKLGNLSSGIIGFMDENEIMPYKDQDKGIKYNGHTQVQDYMRMALKTN